MLDQHALAQKYQIMPGRETVIYTPVSTSGPGTPVSIPGAYRRVLRKRAEHDTQWTVDRDSVEWLLPSARLGLVAPQLYDTLTESSGDVWTITTSQHELLGAVWRLGCIRRRAAS